MRSTVINSPAFRFVPYDFFGDMLFKRLQNEGVDCRFIQRTHFPSTLAFVKIERGAEPRYAFFAENSADRSLVSQDIPENLPDEVECIEFGSISLLMEPLAETIKALVHRESGKRIVAFDPNIRPILIKDKKAYIEEFQDLAGLSEDDARDCLVFAIKASALNCARVGAEPPSAADMLAGNGLNMNGLR